MTADDMREVLDHALAAGEPVVPLLASREYRCMFCAAQDHGRCDDRACVCCSGIPPCPDCGSHDLCPHDGGIAGGDR